MWGDWVESLSDIQEHLKFHLCPHSFIGTSLGHVPYLHPKLAAGNDGLGGEGEKES